MKRAAALLAAALLAAALCLAPPAAAEKAAAAGGALPATGRELLAATARCQCGNSVYEYSGNCRCWCPNRGRKLAGDGPAAGGGGGDGAPVFEGPAAGPRRTLAAATAADGADGDKAAAAAAKCECYGRSSTRIYDGSGCWCSVPC